MKRCVMLLVFLLLLLPFVAAYGVTFYNPAWSPQDGIVYESINANEPYELIVKTPDIAITKIIFYVNEDFKNAGITVYNLNAIPDDLPVTPENTTYEVNEIKYTGFVPHQTVNFVYYFKVNKTWLEERTIPRSSIVLHYYDSKTELWNPLKTDVKGDDDGFVYFKAEYKGVHYLYIGVAEGVVAAPVPAEENEVIITVGESDTDDLTEVTQVDLSKPQKAAPALIPEPQKTPSVSATVDDDSLTTLFFLVILAVVIFAVIMLVGKRKPSVDKELYAYVKRSLKQGKSKPVIRDDLLSVGWHHSRVDKVLAKHKGARTHVKPEAKVASDVVAKAIEKHAFKSHEQPKVEHHPVEPVHPVKVSEDDKLKPAFVFDDKPVFLEEHEESPFEKAVKAVTKKNKEKKAAKILKKKPAKKKPAKKKTKKPAKKTKKSASKKRLSKASKKKAVKKKPKKTTKKKPKKAVKKKAKKKSKKR